MSTRWRRLILPTPPCVKKKCALARAAPSLALPTPSPRIVYTTISASINSAIIRHERDITSHLQRQLKRSHCRSARSVLNKIVLLKPRGWMVPITWRVSFASSIFSPPFKIIIIKVFRPCFRTLRLVFSSPTCTLSVVGTGTRAPPSL